MSPLADEEIHVAIVIRISCAHTLRPPEVADAGFRGDILKVKPTQVVVKMRRQGSTRIVQPIALQKKDVGKTVIVVIDNCNPGAGVFYDVGLIDLTGNHFGAESRLRRDIAEIHLRRLHPWRERTHSLILCVPRGHLRMQPRSESRQSAHSSQHRGKRHESPGHKCYCAFPATDPEDCFRARAIKSRARCISGSMGLSLFAASNSFSPSSRSPAWQLIRPSFL